MYRTDSTLYTLTHTPCEARPLQPYSRRSAGRGAATRRALSESCGDETCRTALLPLSGLAAA
eukprot:1900486-Prymnesium_polylepis.1